MPENRRSGVRVRRWIGAGLFARAVPLFVLAAVVRAGLLVGFGCGVQFFLRLFLHLGHLLARQCVFPLETGGVFEVLELLVDAVDHLDGHTLNNGLVEEATVAVFCNVALGEKHRLGRPAGVELSI